MNSKVCPRLLLCPLPLLLESWRRKAERLRSGADSATKEVAERQSQHPNGSTAPSARHASLDERVRREAARGGAV